MLPEYFRPGVGEPGGVGSAYVHSWVKGWNVSKWTVVPGDTSTGLATERASEHPTEPLSGGSAVPSLFLCMLNAREHPSQICPTVLFLPRPQPRLWSVQSPPPRVRPAAWSRAHRPIYSSSEGGKLGSSPPKDHINESSEKISHKSLELTTTRLCYECLVR